MMNPKEKQSSKFSNVFKSYEQFLKKILNMFLQDDISYKKLLRNITLKSFFVS
ncbi:hypothetical protein [Priestia aryabhattai]|uniref:hypothetical protein n=1 Tax=Priestia aryabhattai TaxID=412384 RepID=UPI001ADB85CD|nr:hypothetical protein [Priestia aryabhattai]QTL52788.1 hypothetical protein J5Z55_30020 [Priestia aryabhattai]